MLSWLWHSSGLRWFVVLVSGGFLGKLRWFPSMTLVWPQRCRRRWLSAGNESRSEEETRRREDFDIEVVIGVGSGGADDWRRIVKEKAVVFVDLRPSKFNFSSSLSFLDLSRNSFTSSMILQWLSNVTSNLVELDLSGNQLNGEIPESNKLPSLLESLSMKSNILEGGIPKSFGNACALCSLDMSNNSLSEEFPLIIHHLSGCARFSLQELNLKGNQINGTLPDLSIFSSLKILDLDGNKLNGEIPKDIKFPPQLEELDMQSNSLKGVLTDYHFANMSKLDFLELSENSLLALAFSQNWVPPFQLSYLGLRSCKLGPVFPKWLETQNQFLDIDISNAGIADMVPKWKDTYIHGISSSSSSIAIEKQQLNR
ncbi:receptor-like protein EIX1 [Glycine max]|uniref:receptor-like protein EIX1 n=1 Tax=Glycine max TaxID=3847 RepID=UPI000E21BEF9|nr:receptor-like protein EIX1 [Glycine max]|eukprot:XP_025981912.1 receptor-like protein EIX1 [Glycine max]